MKDRVGNKHSMLTVTGFSHIQKGQYMWRCICDCGNPTVVSAGNLVSGVIKGCGCLRGKAGTHGLYLSPLYPVWTGIKGRCFDVNHAAYKDYGARGIGMDEVWRNDFKIFHDWCVTNGWKPGLEIDRRDNDGGYFRYNCRCVTTRVNSFNRRTTYMVTYQGDPVNLLYLESISNGVSAHLIYKRHYELGWDIDTAISTPVRCDKYDRVSYSISGTVKTLAEWADQYGLRPIIVSQRIRRGKDISAALYPLRTEKRNHKYDLQNAK